MRPFGSHQDGKRPSLQVLQAMKAILKNTYLLSRLKASYSTKSCRDTALEFMVKDDIKVLFPLRVIKLERCTKLKIDVSAFST